MTRLGGFLFDSWNYGSMILSFIQVIDMWWLVKGFYLWCFYENGSVILSSIQIVDLWWLAKGDLPLTFFMNIDRWSCHPSKSLTCGDSARGISPWLFYEYGSVILVIHPSNQVVDWGDSPRRISLWLLKLWIDDPSHSSIQSSRWLVVTRQRGDFSLTLTIMDQWS